MYCSQMLVAYSGQCPEVETLLCPFTCNACPRVVEFQGDFATVVTNETLFLEECSAALEVKCISVTAGSILVTLRGSDDELNQAIQVIDQQGLSLPSFGTLIKVTTTAAPTSVES